MILLLLTLPPMSATNLPEMKKQAAITAETCFSRLYYSLVSVNFATTDNVTGP